jgi:hypothetical protein
VTPLPAEETRIQGAEKHAKTIEALYSIRTTPYNNSFLSRIDGKLDSQSTGLIAVDWDARAPWTELMADIVAHHRLRQYVLSIITIHFVDPFNLVDRMWMYRRLFRRRSTTYRCGGHIFLKFTTCCPECFGLELTVSHRIHCLFFIRSDVRQ